MHTTGIVFGWVIAAGYVFAVMNFFIKRIGRAGGTGMTRYPRLTRTIVKGHVYVPLFLVTVILLHVMIELVHEGFFITGIITFTLITIQILLGAYGAYFMNRKKGRWLIAHRANAALLFVALSVHAATGIILNP